MESIVVILGNSPFLSEVEDKTQYVLERYYSIGINSIVQKYNTKAHIFQDIGLIDTTNQHPNIKSISLRTYGDLIQKDNKELYNSYSFDFEQDTSEDLFKNDKLAWCGFTHDYAISYCIHKGYKNIVLLGVADFIPGSHYVVDGPFRYSETVKTNSIRFINEVVTKKANLYTCNPNSCLSIPYLSIDELLK